ncbi:MAG TPA: PfkB family carbohydrate kinase, partial [Anaerolineae bacterium]|nr:PfkB family carbohydrate kinase [Anaerolineae bacterium]
LLGKRTAVAACVGEDGFGHYLYKQLEACDVATDFIQFTSQAPTSMAIITRHAGTADFAIARGADAYLQTNMSLEKAAAKSRIVHTSAFGLSREPARGAILEALKIAHEAGSFVSLDPNYHPKIWPDTPEFLAILQAAYQFVEATKPSLDDCVRLFGADHEPAYYAQRFLDWGCQIVVLTLGAQGILLATASGELYEFTGNPIPVVDATGAGDAFWAGFLNTLLDGSSIVDAARLGQVLAEIKLGTVGPLKKLPLNDDLLERAASIQYRKV